MQTLWGIIWLSLWVGLGGQPLDSQGGGEDGAASIAALEDELLGYINEERARAGLNRLAFNETLVEAARLHSEEMAALNYFDHISPTPGQETPLKRFLSVYGRRPYYMVIGENLYYCTRVDAKRAHKRLMDSPTHRENILDPRFREAGVGVYIDDAGQFWVTELFCIIQETGGG